MSFIGDILGTNSSFKASGSPVIDPVTGKQIDAATAAGATVQGAQTDFAGTQIPGAQGALGAQDTLLANFMGIANGTGPNPALEQLHQTTAANVANAAGTVASQRGINPALAAKMALETGATINQQATGQAAVQTAQQQIAAGQVAAGIAGQKVDQYGNAITTAGAQNLQQQQILQGAMANANAAKVNRQNTIDSVNAGVATANTANQTKLIGGAMNGAGAALGMADGGEVPGPTSALGKTLRTRYAKGGNVDGPVPGRAKVPGDSTANDTVPIAATPGEFVVKRTSAAVPGVKALLEEINSSPAAARSFVQHLVARKGGGFEKVIKARGKMAEGGEVEKPAPKADEKAPGWNLADKASALLPDWLSARTAVLVHKDRMAALDAQTAPGSN